jgi:serine/threonine protein phosphatase PrpC
METYAITDQGSVRKENQDRFFLRELGDGAVLAAVADGMGGEAGGALAAQMTVDLFRDFNPASSRAEAQLKILFQKAAENIKLKVQDSPQLNGMGTTLTALYLKDNHCCWAHVGDSRLYHLRSGQLTQVTEDHTYVNLLVKIGELTPERARNHPMGNILIHCIGCQPLEMTAGSLEVMKGDHLILSSDGLHHEVREDQIISLLNQKTDLRTKCSDLLGAALKAGGRDNVTIVGLLI